MKIRLWVVVLLMLLAWSLSSADEGEGAAIPVQRPLSHVATSSA